MKRPSFQFYPGDWQSSSNLRRCTHAEKGAWIDVMCLMHDQPEYGILRWSLKEIAQTIGCSVATLKALQSKGVLKGDDKRLTEEFVYVPRSGRKDGDPVTLVHTQDGPVWYSSRMVKDEYVRTIRAESAGNGASPQASPKGGFGAAKGDPNGGGFGPRDSSSSSSTSVNTPPPPTREAASSEVFPITEGWQPSPAFTTQAKLLGLPVLDAQAMAEGTSEFIAFWLARPNEVRTQAEWENALARSLKSRSVRASARPQHTAPQRRTGAHAGFDSKDYTAGVNPDGTLV